MAVIETGAIFKSLVFGGVDSADYGIYITGEAVYNAPVRAVEMVSVPGRNGAIAIDQGYYENIEITYPCGTFAESQTEFATNLASFRNAILSQKGYNRLTDTYNPNEYRMATYIAGLEVSPANIGIAGEFELTFNAKPQRFLTSGETKVSISTSGSTIPNPTLYEASPMLEVTGYGTIGFNGYSIDVDAGLYGDIIVVEQGSSTRYSGLSCDFITKNYNNGDTITVGATTWVVRWSHTNHNYQNCFESANITTGNATYVISNYGQFIEFTIPLSEITFTAGTTGQALTSISGTVTHLVGGTSTTSSFTFKLQIDYYDLSTDRIFYTVVDPSAITGVSFSNKYTITYKAVTVDSTVSYLGTPTYIDCDLGVCYKIENDTVIDLNAYIDLGSDLPVLSPGANTITYDNTVTSLKVTPRWWQL